VATLVVAVEEVWLVASLRHHGHDAWRRRTMQTHLSHIQFNVQAENLAFYRDLFAFLGWQTLYDGDGMLGVGTAAGSSLWFAGQVKDVSNDYDGPGMNHLGIGTATQDEVDAAAAYLQERSVAHLFETPRHRPEFSSEGQTYYQVMFESPDHILLEIVYIGPLAA
jgi:catechol 2,3-dioxygenase-like lactoylglutathione lyase family enzyme